jgi:hypothetical protein
MAAVERRRVAADRDLEGAVNDYLDELALAADTVHKAVVGRDLGDAANAPGEAEDILLVRTAVAGVGTPGEDTQDLVARSRRAAAAEEDREAAGHRSLDGLQIH